MSLGAVSCAAHHDDFALDSAPAPAKALPPSVDSPIGDLLANPAAKAVLVKDLPGLVSYNDLDQIEGMTVRQIASFPQADIDKKTLAGVQADLRALSATK
jgi:hypothetical protein